jgi:hypothetical protein
MTYNELVGKIAHRAGELSSMPIDSLRAMMPETTDTRSELVRLHKHVNRATLVETILYDEFEKEFDAELPED